MSQVSVDADVDLDIDFKTLKSEKISLAKERIGGENVFAEHSTLSNDSFGDIIMIVELYNTYIKLYSQILDEKSVNEDVKLTEINYERFIDCVKDDENTETNYKYFVSIVETILRIFINNDRRFVKTRDSFAQINSFSLQDLCRVVLQLDKNVCNIVESSSEVVLQQDMAHVQSITNICDAFVYWKGKIQRKDRVIIEDLYMTDFKSFKQKQKIDLIVGLCLSILNLDIFLTSFNELHFKITEKKSEIRSLKAKLLELETKGDSKEHQDVFGKLKTLEAELTNLTNFMNTCVRKEPIGHDAEENTYWRFEFLPDYIIRETPNNMDIDDLLKANMTQKKMISKENKWFRYSINKNELYDLINYLGMKSMSNSKLIIELKKYRKIEKPTNEEAVCEEKIENNFENLNIKRSIRVKNKKTEKDNEQDEEMPKVIENKESSIFDIYNHLEPIDALYKVSLRFKIIIFSSVIFFYCQDLSRFQ